jgi:hypothetical protein
MRVACVGGCGASIVVKLPEEVDDFEDLDSEKVQERKEVRECCVRSIIGKSSSLNRYRAKSSRGISKTIM